MSDIPYINQAQEVKITGQDSAGTTVNYVSADSNGNLLTKDYATGTTGAAVPTNATLFGAKDGSGNLQPTKINAAGSLQVAGEGVAGTPAGGVVSIQGVSGGTAVPASQSGTWNITNISGTVSLPTGASTSALQTTGNTSLASIDDKLSSDNSTVTSVSSSTASTTLLAANSSRRGFSIYNSSGRIIYVIFGTGTPTSSLYSIRLSSNDYYESSTTVTYRGIIKCVTASGTGDVNVTEFT